MALVVSTSCSECVTRDDGQHHSDHSQLKAVRSCCRSAGAALLHMSVCTSSTKPLSSPVIWHACCTPAQAQWDVGKHRLPCSSVPCLVACPDAACTPALAEDEGGIVCGWRCGANLTVCCAVLRCAEVPMHLQVMAGEFVAGAMMATLPAIDANDPPKTLASFRFYCMVLSSVGTLQVS